MSPDEMVLVWGKITIKILEKPRACSETEQYFYRDALNSCRKFQVYFAVYETFKDVVTPNIMLNEAPTKNLVYEEQFHTALSRSYD